MEAVTESQELVVWAEKRSLPEAKDAFSKFDASFRTIASRSSIKGITESKVNLFYLRELESGEDIEWILKAFHGRKGDCVLYTPHHSTDFAFRVGKLVGKHSLDQAVWASNFRRVEQLLRARNVFVQPGDGSQDGFAIGEARKRLGMTQDQMASALNVTTRTLQNWERALGTSQMPKKTQDLREFLSLMDDYVLASKEREWLESPLPAVQNRRPIDVIATGKLRDLIVEFHRLREGQPV